MNLEQATELNYTLRTDLPMRTYPAANPKNFRCAKEELDIRACGKTVIGETAAEKLKTSRTYCSIGTG